MIRRIIQVTIDQHGFTLALCNDGTLWRATHDSWREMPEIPQSPSTGDAGKLIAQMSDMNAVKTALEEKLERVHNIAFNYKLAPNKNMANIGERICKIIEGESQ